MIEAIKHVVAELLSLQAKTQYGTITAYNPNDYTVKALLQPDGVETGWIPLAAPWVGAAYGAVFGPPIGTDCRVDFVGGVPEASIAGSRFFNANFQPPVVQSGQGAIVDKAGSYVKLNGDGTITLGANVGITSTTPLLKQIGDMEVDGNVKITGTELVQGLFTATDGMAISGGTGATATITGNITTTGTITNNGVPIDSTHYHNGVQTGTGNTSTPL